MKTEIYKHIEVLTNRYPALGSVKKEIAEAIPFEVLAGLKFMVFKHVGNIMELVPMI